MTKVSISWPKEVPILEAEDICRGNFHRGEKACLSGWVLTVINIQYPRFNDIIKRDCLQNKIRKSIMEEIIRIKSIDGPSIVLFNDNMLYSKKLIAQIWNKAMARLGYTEGNPERKTE